MKEPLFEKPQQDSPFAIWHWSNVQLALFCLLHIVLAWAVAFIFFSVVWM